MQLNNLKQLRIRKQFVKEVNKYLQGLESPHISKRKGLCVVSGPNSVEFALRKALEFVKEIFVGDYTTSITLDPKRITEVDDLSSAYGGIALTLDTSYFDFSKPPTGQYIVVLDNIRDPGNLGTIIRTCDAAGIKSLILSGDCVSPINPKVIRASAGSIFNINITKVTGLEQVKHFDWASDQQLDHRNDQQLGNANTSNLEKRYNLVGLDLYGKPGAEPTNLFDTHLEPGSALVFGNEAWGLTDQDKELINQFVKIPMYGEAESLNLAVSVGIAVYTAVS
jgi:TrmH family RNA methyltransferase